MLFFVVGYCCVFWSSLKYVILGIEQQSGGIFSSSSSSRVFPSHYIIIADLAHISLLSHFPTYANRKEIQYRNRWLTRVSCLYQRTRRLLSFHQPEVEEAETSYRPVVWYSALPQLKTRGIELSEHCFAQVLWVVLRSPRKTKRCRLVGGSGGTIRVVSRPKHCNNYYNERPCALTVHGSSSFSCSWSGGVSWMAVSCDTFTPAIMIIMRSNENVSSLPVEAN